MLKPITASLVLLLVTLASQGASAAPTPLPKFKIPGLGTYRSGVGFVGDANELPWKQAVDAAATKAAKESPDAAKKGLVTPGSIAAGLVGGGVGSVGGAIDGGMIDISV